MSSYLANPTAPTAADMVRRLIGDTTAPFALTDAEVGMFLADWPNTYKAASVACTSLAAQYSALADKGVGQSRISLSQRAKAYSERAKELRQLRNGRGSMQVLMGGQTWAQVQTQRSNSSLIQPSFWRSDFDFWTTRDPVWGWGTIGTVTTDWWEGGWPW